jgi:hypothetical protein
MSWRTTVREGRWSEWRGLPPQLPESALGVTPLARTSALLSRHRRELITFAGGRYWLDRGTVVLYELVDPPSDLAATALLETLGPPAHERDGRHLRDGATTTEYVYPDRGLAVTVARSYDDPPSFEPRLAQVLLFAPTDMRTFILELGGNDRPGPSLGPL